MRIKLNVTYTQKDEAKALGARWDRYQKTWYIDDPDDLSIFAKWLTKQEQEFYQKHPGFTKRK